MQQQPNNPLHGIKLEQIVTELKDHYGWEYMAFYTSVKVFSNNPTVKSSLKMLRKTQWARDKVEEMYLNMLKQQQKKE